MHFSVGVFCAAEGRASDSDKANLPATKEMRRGHAKVGKWVVVGVDV